MYNNMYSNMYSNMYGAAYGVALLCSASEEHIGGPSARLPDLLGMPEPEFAERLRAGDDAIYATLYQVFHPRLVAIASAYVSSAIAEELAQDVLAHVWERRATWQIDDGIGIYLYTAVRNRALKQIRHDRVVARLEHAPFEEAPPGMGGSAEPADARVRRADIRAAVDAALARLSEGARTAFLLRWMHELSYPEIARIMGTSEVTARQHVAKARRAVVPVLEVFARE